MTLGEGRTVAMSAALAGLGFACCAWCLVGTANGQQAAAANNPVQKQPSNPRKAGPEARPAPLPKSTPTYTRDIAPILQSKCQTCHRRHQVGPFGLETYEQARKRSNDIAFVTEERSMPPWKPTRGVGPKLKHDQSLTPAEIEILAAWAAAGAPWATRKIFRRRALSLTVGSSARPT